jgi:hypothetical protein
MQWIEALINLSAFAGFIGLASTWPDSAAHSKDTPRLR